MDSRRELVHAALKALNISRTDSFVCGEILITAQSITVGARITMSGATKYAQHPDLVGTKILVTGTPQGGAYHRNPLQLLKAARILSCVGGC